MQIVEVFCGLLANLEFIFLSIKKQSTLLIIDVLN